MYFSILAQYFSKITIWLLNFSKNCKSIPASFFYLLQFFFIKIRPSFRSFSFPWISLSNLSAASHFCLLLMQVHRATRRPKKKKIMPSYSSLAPPVCFHMKVTDLLLRARNWTPIKLTRGNKLKALSSNLRFFLFVFAPDLI